MTIWIDEHICNDIRDILIKLKYNVKRPAKRSRDTGILLEMLNNKHITILITCDKKFNQLCKQVHVNSILLKNNTDVDTAIRLLTNFIINKK